MERRASWRIDDVLARTDLAELLDNLTEPAAHVLRGRRWHCPIPDHDDQHPSVTIRTDHRGHERWRCWSGDDTHRGDAIDLVMATQRLPRTDALDWLANRAGMTPDQPLPPVQRKPRPAAPQHVPLDPSVTSYAQACERILWSNGGAEVRDWLHHRGFTDELLRANHVGADPGRHLMRRSRGLPYGHSAAAVFPALDANGTITYLQARYLNPIGHDKYDNPAGSLGSNPRIAWTRTPTNISRSDVLVICEGIPDALTAAGSGLNAVAVLGSQAPDERVASTFANHANEHGERLVAIVDADAAGRSWSRRLADLLAGHNHGLAVIQPPTDGHDLNTWAQADPDWSTRTLLAPDPDPARPVGSGHSRQPRGPEVDVGC